MGELGTRLRLTADRIVSGGPPAFTRELVVADAVGVEAGDASRGSGDLAGPYLGALSLLPPPSLDLAALTREILAGQRTDGRFGSSGLRFSGEALGPAHIALIRGNGRLLVGLLEHFEAGGDGATLAAARRLGEFLLSAVGPLEGSPPPAPLCEGLTLLGEATDEARYYEAARRLGSRLAPRGSGPIPDYLTALRGLVRLAGLTADAGLLQEVEARYRDFVSSQNGLPYGGVMDPRHEGCATADFLRLSLQLWRATSTPEYLEGAERCLLNHFSFDQLGTGDFRPRAEGGAGVEAEAAPPWWCCTLDGYRTFRDVLDHLVRREGDTTCVDLFQDADVTLPGLSVALRHTSEEPGSSRFSVEILDASRDLQGVSVRKPAWAASILVLFDGTRVTPRPGDSVYFKRRWRPGETLELVLEHALRLTTRDGRLLGPSSLESDTEAMLFVGPWLMAADDATNPALFSGPGPGEGTVLLPLTLAQAQVGEGETGLSNRARHLRLRYLLGERTSPETITLRPLAEQTSRARPGAVAAWLRYRGPRGSSSR
jgi:DUF1680 family protein